jgi:hypothetical protein
MANEPTAERKAALDAENERQAAQSFRFLQRNPRYINSAENNTRLADYIQAQGLTWDVENLEDALADIGSNMLKTEDEAEAAPRYEVKEPVKASDVPWPTPLTAAIIRDMPRGDYKKYIKDMRFIEAVAALKLHRS